MTYKSKNNFIIENMAGETVILPVNNNVVALTKILLLNPTAAFILQKMIDGKNKEQIIKDINENFEVNNQNIENEVDDFIEKMINCGYFCRV